MDADFSQDIQPLPDSIAEKVALDSLKRIVYVDSQTAGNPFLQTWIDRHLSAGIQIKIERRGLDEIGRLRQSGLRQVEQGDVDMKVLADAVELLKLAAQYRASDVHLMMRGSHAEIQIDAKGGLRTLKQMGQSEGLALERAIYQGLAKVRDSSHNLLDFQNAQIPGEVMPPNTGLTSVRIIRGPCYPQAAGGSFLTMRLQYEDSKPAPGMALKPLDLPKAPGGKLNLGGMGYTPGNIAKLKLLSDAPNGIVIFTGPTGSGKTTSLNEALRELARIKPHRRLVTIEDPVEYPMPWAVQLIVTNARTEAETGIAFLDRLRAALRMAPKIILLGELRGRDVAVAALEAAVTGHQVWTTLHVTDPFLFVERLEIMDNQRLSRKVFCDHKIVRGVVAQRLLPQVCPDCSELLNNNSKAISSRLFNALKSWGDVSKVRLKGNNSSCKTCNGDGTVARFAVAEVVVTDAELMKDFVEHGSETARDRYRARPNSDPSMLVQAIRHTLKGLVDPRSVEEEVDLIESNPHPIEPTPSFVQSSQPRGHLNGAAHAHH